MFIKAIAVLTLTAASSQAGVIYDFIGMSTGTSNNFPTPQVFQLTLPNFINAPVDSPFLFFGCGQLDSSTNCAPLGVGFERCISSCVPGDDVFFSLTPIGGGSGGDNFLFPTGAFTHAGTYTSSLAPGTLSVTVTPEPSTILLILSGLCLCSLPRLRIGR